jgi:drug/metabolite transporter (DMT)-like permease
VRASWRVASLAGATGTLASAGWFTAMTRTIAAYVRTLGLVELLFTFAVGHLAFRETPTRARSPAPRCSPPASRCC